jgi:hypothetical protein
MKSINKDKSICRTLTLLCLLAPVAACDGDLAVSPKTPLPDPSSTPELTTPAPTPSNQPSILVDATRDGGVWWCCQPGSHQGKKLAEYLMMKGGSS